MVEADKLKIQLDLVESWIKMENHVQVQSARLAASAKE